MSAIATFICLPVASIPGLRAAAVPKKGWFGGRKDTYHDFLGKQGKAVANYRWSGYVLATLLPFLSQKGIDLMKSENRELARYLSEKRSATCFILMSGHKQHLPHLAPELFSADEMRNYYNQFNATKESGVGEAMLDGVRALGESLRHVSDDSFVLLSIG